MCIEWEPIETSPEFKTILAHHVDDLYPSVCFRIGNQWFRETEGPEDTNYRRLGKHKELYRPPTHWKPIPDPPI